INGQGHLEIGGCDTTQLAKQYGTPLYVYDEESIRGKCRAFHRAFKESGFSYQVAYASCVVSHPPISKCPCPLIRLVP
ncbi:hypothetical protein ACT453_59085, partial [Bacillus sp. D-CC]